MDYKQRNKMIYRKNFNLLLKTVKLSFNNIEEIRFSKESFEYIKSLNIKGFGKRTENLGVLANNKTQFHISSIGTNTLKPNLNMIKEKFNDTFSIKNKKYPRMDMINNFIKDLIEIQKLAYDSSISLEKFKKNHEM